MSKETGGIRIDHLQNSTLPYVDEDAFKDHPNYDALKKSLSIEYSKPFLRNFWAMKTMLELLDVDIRQIHQNDLRLQIVQETIKIQRYQDVLRDIYANKRQVRMKFYRSPLQLAVAARDFMLTQLRFQDYSQYISVVTNLQIKHNMKAHVTKKLSIKECQEILEREKLNAALKNELNEKGKTDKLKDILLLLEKES